MAGRNANEAFQRYIEPLRAALQCLTLERLTLRERQRLAVGMPYSVVLNDMDPVPLRAAVPLYLRAGQNVRIIETEPGDPRGPFKATTIRYLYAFSILTDEGFKELLSFHWTPEASGSSVVTFPHLHVGHILLAHQRIIRPNDLHKAHVPTGPVAIEAIVRLAISELNVEPLHDGWDAILRQTENILG